jgi:hypothetical protein
MRRTWQLAGEVLMHRYDVALWSWWPGLFPTSVCLVEAPHAFAAIEQLMRSCGLRRVAYASARALDGSLVYRACQVWLCPERTYELTAEELAAFG